MTPEITSPFFSAVLPGPAGISPTGTSRLPDGPVTVTVAPAATSPGTLSAAGEPLQRLPTSVARPCTWVEPTSSIPSTTPGQSATSAAFAPSSAPETATPICQPPSFVRVIAFTPSIFFRSIRSSGVTIPARSCTRTSVPPARNRVTPAASAANAEAASNVEGV